MHPALAGIFKDSGKTPIAFWWNLLAGQPLCQLVSNFTNSGYTFLWMTESWIVSRFLCSVIQRKMFSLIHSLMSNPYRDCQTKPRLSNALSGNTEAPNRTNENPGSTTVRCHDEVAYICRTARSTWFWLHLLVSSCDGICSSGINPTVVWQRRLAAPVGGNVRIFLGALGWPPAGYV